MSTLFSIFFRNYGMMTVWRGFVQFADFLKETRKSTRNDDDYVEKCMFCKYVFFLTEHSGESKI
jgi:hypothetical protein